MMQFNSKKRAVVCATPLIMLAIAGQAGVHADEPAPTPVPTAALKNFSSISESISHEGVRITSDIDVSYEKMERADYDALSTSQKAKLNFRPGTKIPEQNPAGPYSVAVRPNIDGSINVHTTPEWKTTFLEAYQEGNFKPHKEWAFYAKVQAVPSKQIRTANPQYTWEYTGHGTEIVGNEQPVDGVPEKVIGYSPDLIKPNAEATVPNSSADIAVALGDEPSQVDAVHQADTTDWPKNAQIKVTVKDGNDESQPELTNYYFIKFHMSHENWVEFQQTDEAKKFDISSYELLEGDVINFDPGTPGPGTVAPRQEFSSSGTSGYGEKMDIWVDPQESKFWVGIDDEGLDTIGNMTQLVTGYMGAGLAGKIATKYAATKIVTMGAPHVGNFTPGALETLFSVIATKVALQPLDASVVPGRDIVTTTNDWDGFKLALLENRVTGIPPSVNTPANREIALSETVGANYPTNPIWPHCRLILTMVRVSQLRWFHVDYYDRHGYVGQITASISIPFLPRPKRNYEWVG